MLLLFSGLIIASIMSSANVFAVTYNITPKAPRITESLKPIIVKYKKENYVGAMQDLEELVKVEKGNIYAKYYLALCYTRLGYKEEAKTLYSEIVNKDENLALSYYSRRAMTCLENPNSEMCAPQVKPPKQEQVEITKNDDIALFIESGQKIHPSAMDRITSERMVRKIEEAELQRRQMEMQEQQGLLKSDATKPTNDEIVAAITTLQKIGINPYGANQFNPLAQAQQYSQLGMLNNPFMMGANQTPDVNLMHLYSQLAQQNNIMNYGI